MFLARYAVFELQESPKYLLAKGRDQEAIEVRIPEKNSALVLNYGSPLDRCSNTLPSETVVA
jgi:hypothetical protein